MYEVEMFTFERVSLDEGRKEIKNRVNEYLTSLDYGTFDLVSVENQMVFHTHDEYGDIYAPYNTYNEKQYSFMTTVTTRKIATGQIF